MAAKLRFYCWVPLLACALPAAAQTSVTLTGGVDAFVGSMTNSGDITPTTLHGDCITTLPSAMSHGLGVRHSF
ncbi:hypothetical protein [Pseudoduganella lutea]|uniref:Uncharacterized protein n=1 Tax=Pseudoduganella lutea TaxID=321985 RepID=A0A4P6L085_9BURK|nr:hypothetical protein [Pseudoduganella lutea]QBE63998.1 hypothetical protein EWM63_14195 [Pseudoduganella lutea]